MPSLASCLTPGLLPIWSSSFVDKLQELCSSQFTSNLLNNYSSQLHSLSALGPVGTSILLDRQHSISAAFHYEQSHTLRLSQRAAEVSFWSNYIPSFEFAEPFSWIKPLPPKSDPVSLRPSKLDVLPLGDCAAPAPAQSVSFLKYTTNTHQPISALDELSRPYVGLDTKPAAKQPFNKVRGVIYRLSHILARRFKPASQAILYCNLRFLYSELDGLNSFMQLVSPLLNFDAQQLLPYYEGWMPRQLSVEKLQWTPLGPVGRYPISLDLFSFITDLDRPRHYCSVLGCSSCSALHPPPTARQYVPALWNMTQELLSKDCISFSPDGSPTGHYFIQPKPNSSKLRAIFHGAYANSSFPFLPSKFSLPNFESVKPYLRLLQPVFFHRTDIQNYFWSFVLPKELQSHFVFEVRDPTGVPHCFSLLRSPFGWDYIPSIANHVMHSIIDCHLTDSYKHLIYYDDILGFSLTSDICNSTTNNVRSSIQQSGFVIHPPGSDKSSAIADTSTHFVGKGITSGSNPSIFNLQSTANACLFAAIVGTATKLRIKQVQSITGTLLWGTSHNKLGKPFLYGMHRICAISSSDKLWILKNTRHNCIRTFLAGNQPWTPAEILFDTSPPASVPMFFCDAAYIHSSGGVCGIFRGIKFYLRWLIPSRYNTSQQLAELYVFVHAFRWLSRRFSSFALATDSQSTLFSAQSFNAGVKQPYRARLLSQLSQAVSSLSLPVYAGWVPSDCNPADAASRSWPFTNAPCGFTSLLPLDSSLCKFSLC